VHVETKAVVNPWQQRAHRERRVVRALRRHKGQHGIGDFVGPMRPAFPGHESRDSLRLEGGLRLIERRPREAEHVGRSRDGLALYVHSAQHFVLHLHEIPGVEEFVGCEQRVAYRVGARMKRALGTQGLRFGIAAGWSWSHSKYNNAAHHA